MSKFIFCCIRTLSFLFMFMGFLPASLIHGQENEVTQAVKQSESIGVLILAHGTHHVHGKHGAETPTWEATVLKAIQPLRDKYSTEVAFGMADPDTIREAVRKLEENDVHEAIIVPLFISSYSPIIGNARFIFGLQEKLPETTSIESLPRIKSKIRFYMTGALDDSILVAQILLERAKELSINTANETVILVGHGPNDEKENRLLLDDMQRLANHIHERGKFKEVQVATWRSDAPEEIKNKAINKLRDMVETCSKESRVIVIPHLLAPGGAEMEIVEALQGLTYIYNGKTLLPHDNITKWIETKAEEGLLKFNEQER